MLKCGKRKEMMMENKIRLHPKYGVNPSIEQAQCPVCGKIFDTGNILMFGYNRGKEAPRTLLNKIELCNKDQELYEEGYIALVAVDESKSDKLENGNLKPQSAWRTGKLAHMKKELFNDFFKDMNLKGDEKLIYVDDKLIDALNERAKETNNE